MCEYLEFFALELRCRRRALGLSLKDRCLLLADSASQHSGKRFQAFKSEFCRRRNVAAWHGYFSLYRFCDVILSLFVRGGEMAVTDWFDPRAEVLLTGDSDDNCQCSVPGGFGAAGALVGTSGSIV